MTSYRALDIVVVKVRDWPAAVAWYGDVLGLALGYREDGDQWCQFRFPEGGATLALLGVPDVDTTSAPRCLPDIRVDDLDAALAGLAGRGVTPVKPARDSDEGFRIATIADPEGNLLQLYQYVDAR